MSLTQQELDDWNEWIVEHYHELTRFAARLIGEHEAAACVNTALMRLRDHWSKLPEEGHRIAWTLTTLRNACSDLQRQVTRRRKRTQEASAFGDAASPLDLRGDEREPAPDQGLQLAENAALVQEALQQLSPEQREAITWRYFEGLTFQEIADRSGVPLSTIASRCSRGLLQLQERLRSHMQE